MYSKYNKIIFTIYIQIFRRGRYCEFYLDVTFSDRFISLKSRIHQNKMNNLSWNQSFKYDVHLP